MQEVEFRARDNCKNEIAKVKAIDWDCNFNIVTCHLEYENGSIEKKYPEKDYGDDIIFIQYIGIKDVHRKKVFRGDIVKVKETIYTDCSREEIEEVREFTGEVVWHQYGWHIAEKVEIGTRYHSLWLWNVEGEEDDTMEIIGNRWDNPELVVI